ncbi:MAG TPA: DNA-directed RNA polymerase subunit omega [Clostridia bacterium]|jgi:DNA-directed RNA polymerase subunit K/omega|nr:DNA-directed RNA polymerase subunit omega [Clostridiaceae bacterium]HOF25942.1 DNA-directed RNA polymerase subunit omega [Clostridia bacterium]HOM33615.1 DNA-directed RNA polymerase subunit omega [Clostridia bacterium]HOR88967.1 DNA-directed RNA polymerase subunit omega [Clostridia bacterium]HOT70617.1 DNA-directed RNA polymerase subunit omega [Clostridia bacterium]
MINKPSVEQLEKKIPVRFVIVNALAKRSREIAGGARVRIETNEKNPITVAAMEIDSGAVRVVDEPIAEELQEEEIITESESVDE